MVFGFINRILSFANKFESNKFVFAWDSGKSLRRDLYPDYKIKPPIEMTKKEAEIREACIKQFGELRTKVLPSLGFKNIFIQTGYEADDIIASILTNNYNKDKEFILASDDADLYQLLDYCKMWKLRSNKFYTRENLYKEWGCTPSQWADQKVYSGCKGDGVPNVAGIGYGRAIQFIKGELQGRFLVNCRSADPEFLRRNRKLVQLPFDGVKPFKIVNNETFSLEIIMEILSNYGLFSLTRGEKLTAWKRFTNER